MNLDHHDSCPGTVDAPDGSLLPPRESEDPGAWSVLEWGLWARRLSGELAGLIEHRRDGSFEATGGAGCILGSFPTLSEAQAAFEHDRRHPGR